MQPKEFEEIKNIINSHLSNGKGCGDDVGGWLYPVDEVMEKLESLISQHFLPKSKVREKIEEWYKNQETKIWDNKGRRLVDLNNLLKDLDL